MSEEINHHRCRFLGPAAMTIAAAQLGMIGSASVASGIAAITSALPSLAPATVPLGVGVIAVLLLGNLRGIRQAGTLFAAPTYVFIFAIFALVAVGLFQAAGRGFHPTPTPPLPALEGVSVLLLLRAFASGSTR